MPKALFYRILPLVMFLFIWTLTITLYKTVSLGLYEVSSFTWQVILISLITVSIGYLIVFFFYENYKFTETARIASPVESNILYYVLLIISLLSFLGTFSYLYFLASSSSSMTDFLSDPIKARMLVTRLERESITNWNPILAMTNYLASFNMIGILVGGYYYVFGEKNKIIAIFPVIISIFFSIVSFQRYFFIQTIIIWLFCIIYSLYFQKKEIRKKQALKSFILIAGSAVGIFLFVIGILLARIDYGTGEVDMFQTVGWAMKSLTTYLVSEMVALDRFLLQSDSLLYGLSIFRSFIKWLIRIGIYDSTSGLTVYYEFTKVGKSVVNTYTYIRPFYEDFGIYGLLIFNFGFGIVGSITVHNLLIRFSFAKLYIASLIFFGYFLSFFNSTFLNLTMYIFLYVIVRILEKYMLHKSSLSIPK